jgi:hypothetical protein
MPIGTVYPKMIIAVVDPCILPPIATIPQNRYGFKGSFPLAKPLM